MRLILAAMFACIALLMNGCTAEVEETARVVDMLDNGSVEETSFTGVVTEFSDGVFVEENVVLPSIVFVQVEGIGEVGCVIAMHPDDVPNAVKKIGNYLTVTGVPDGVDIVRDCTATPRPDLETGEGRFTDEREYTGIVTAFGPYWDNENREKFIVFLAVDGVGEIAGIVDMRPKHVDIGIRQEGSYVTMNAVPRGPDTPELFTVLSIRARPELDIGEVDLTE